MRLNGRITTLNSIQYNAAIKYLEKNEFRIKADNSKVLIFIVSSFFLLLFFYILKFFIAL